jgi:carboxymethylenebutenolidase
MPIVTSEEGLSTSRPEIASGEHEMHAYFACLKGKERRPGLLVIHEAYGVTAYIEDVVRRFAHAGFATLAPGLLGGVTVPQPGDKAGFGKLNAELDDREVLADLGAATEWLKHHGRCNGKVGTVGFCFGARYAMLLAFTSDKISAVAPFYGQIVARPLPGAPAPKAPKLSPIELADGLTGALQGHFGGKDAGIPAADVHALEEKLKAAGKSAEIFLYPDAGHAFHRDDGGDNYLEASAKQAFQRTVDFFKKQLGA